MGEKKNNGRIKIIIDHPPKKKVHQAYSPFSGTFISRDVAIESPALLPMQGMAFNVKSAPRKVTCTMATNGWPWVFSGFAWERCGIFWGEQRNYRQKYDKYGELRLCYGNFREEICNGIASALIFCFLSGTSSCRVTEKRHFWGGSFNHRIVFITIW